MAFKCTKSLSRCGSAPDPAATLGPLGDLTALPQTTLARFRGRAPGKGTRKGVNMGAEGRGGRDGERGMGRGTCSMGSRGDRRPYAEA